MRKVVWILAVLVITMLPLSVFAADNRIQIELPDGMEGEEVQYRNEDEEIKSVKVGVDNMAYLTSLADGTYHIIIPDTDSYIFEPIEVTLPYQMTEKEEPIYDLVICPKYALKAENIETPVTGDNHKTLTYVGIGIISLIIVVIMSCHNRFKCDRMTDKYSRRRRI